MKRLAWFLVLVLALALAGVLFIHDPGSVTLSFLGWHVQTNFVVFALGLVVLYLLLRVALRLLGGVLRLPRWLRERGFRRRKAAARKALETGLVDFAEGRWSLAERKLLGHVGDSETPLIHYLAAAHAAQRQGDLARRDRHLRSAYEAMPQAQLAIGLTQAELQMASGQQEQALATLRHLHELEPRHDHVTRLLAHVCRQVGDWTELMQLLPALRRMKVQVLPESELMQLEVDALLGRLRLAESEGVSAVTRLWMEARRPVAELEEVTAGYARILCRLGEFATAVDLLERRLKSRWSDELVSLWGQVSHPDPEAALARVENWLKTQPESVALLLAGARIAESVGQFDKARGWLETAVRLAPSVQAHRMLGQLALSRKDSVAAARHFSEALSLSGASAMSARTDQGTAGMPGGLLPDGLQSLPPR
ncbi:MAG: heme biosynthesis protein HemY [Halothiobacillaceae bacterium]